MTISEQLHRSATHAAGNDPACPVCAKAASHDGGMKMEMKMEYCRNCGHWRPDHFVWGFDAKNERTYTEVPCGCGCKGWWAGGVEYKKQN